MGIYKYSEASAGQATAMENLWLELYLGDASEPVALVKFAPPTLSALHLDATRVEVRPEWLRTFERVAEERLASVNDPRLTKLNEIGGGEGFVTYTGELDGRPALNVDNGTLANIFGEEDITAAPVTVQVFADVSVLQRYVNALRKLDPSPLGFRV